MGTICESRDLLVFSDLRWDLVTQRPQHLLSRYVKHRRVFYFEAAVFGMTDVPRLHLMQTSEGVQVITPHLPADPKKGGLEAILRGLVDELIFDENLTQYTLWYCSPSALTFSRHLDPVAIIYDCLDDFPEKSLELELIAKADLVFAAARPLYEIKKHLHHNIHSFPNCVDYGHFSQARLQLVEPDDQVQIPYPRIGFHGNLDSSLDIQLLTGLAQKLPDFHFILIGPIERIELPKGENIHYLGKKDYHALPLYIAGWDCAFIPIAIDNPKQFHGPNWVPEYLAAGKPVVCPPLHDLIFPYVNNDLIHIAASIDEFSFLIEKAMSDRCSDPEWLDKVDWFLNGYSWEVTFSQMASLESDLFKEKPIDDRNQAVIDAITITAGGTK